MKPTADVIAESTREFAKRVAKGMVLPNIEDAHERDAVKERMAKWMNVVVAHQKDSSELRANLALDEQTKLTLLREMRDAREQIFEDIFGR